MFNFLMEGFASPDVMPAATTAIKVSQFRHQQHGFSVVLRETHDLTIRSCHPHNTLYQRLSSLSPTNIHLYWRSDQPWFVYPMTISMRDGTAEDNGVLVPGMIDGDN